MPVTNPRDGGKKKKSVSAGAKGKSIKKTTIKKTGSKSSKVQETRDTAHKEEHGFLTEAAENVEAGAEIVGEKISDFAVKTSETAGKIFEVVKKGLSSAYDTGAKVVDEITQTSQEYIDKYKQNMEMKKLSEKRDKLTAKLGLETFSRIKMKKIIPQKLQEDKELFDLVTEIEMLNKEIVKIGKKLEKVNKSKG